MTFFVRYEYDTKIQGGSEENESSSFEPAGMVVAVTNECAKRVHEELYVRIEGSFPSAECRLICR